MRRLSKALSIAVAALAAACTSVTSLDGRRMNMRTDAFRDYVESVFRAQNAVATELAFALESEPPQSDSYAMLEAAETELLEACAGLNALAARRRDGESAGGLRAARAARAAPRCERATQAAEAALAAAAGPGSG